MSADAVDQQLVRALQGRVADRMTAHNQQRERRGEPVLPAASEQQFALSVIGEIVREHMREELHRGRAIPENDQRLTGAIFAAMYGAGELQDLLEDAQIENIDINGADGVWITYADGRKVRGRPVAATDEDLIAIVQNLGSYAGINARPFTPANPELDLRLPDGSRLSAVMSATERPAVSIRRNRFPQMFLDRRPDHVAADGTAPTLVELETVDLQLATFLRAAVAARHNIMVAGATNAGKTTLLRALINCIDPDERLLTVERALELGIGRHRELHHDVVEFEEVLPDAEGRGGITIGQLVRRTRRHNPSRVIVGEVLGPEVVEMLSAMSQGNNGSLSTIHARDAADVFHRLATYAAQFENLDFAVTHALIASSIDFVVFVYQNPQMNGRRCVAEVLEVTGLAEGAAARARIFSPSPVHGRAERNAEVSISRAKALAAAGYEDTAVGWDSGWGYGR